MRYNLRSIMDSSLEIPFPFNLFETKMLIRIWTDTSHIEHSDILRSILEMEIVQTGCQLGRATFLGTACGRTSKSLQGRGEYFQLDICQMLCHSANTAQQAINAHVHSQPRYRQYGSALRSNGGRGMLMCLATVLSN
jgi:hypothetical protein